MGRQFLNMSHVTGAAVISGLAGGLAEVLWVGVSAATLDIDGWRVAREVAVTVLPFVAGSTIAPALGFIVHFVLSIALAVGFVYATERVLPHAGPGTRFAAAVTSLAVVWAVNFLVVLPWLNPAFVALLPLGVTLVSKLLFAVALWSTFAALSGNPWTRGAIRVSG